MNSTCYVAAIKTNLELYLIFYGSTCVDRSAGDHHFLDHLFNSKPLERQTIHGAAGIQRFYRCGRAHESKNGKKRKTDQTLKYTCHACSSRRRGEGIFWAWLYNP